MSLLYSFLKTVFYSLICYMVLFMAVLPFLLIPDGVYPNLLSSILIKESAFLIAGIIIIIVAKHYSIYKPVNFKLLKSIKYYLVTVFVILSFCCILDLCDIIDVKLYEVASLSAFVKFLIYCIVPTFFIGFGEEFLFRWFLLNRLKSFLNIKTAIICSSLIFCIGHNWNLPNMLSAFTAGSLFALIYYKTDSIFNCISIHSAWNFGQRFFFEGMSEFPYDGQRFLLLKIRDLNFYNWAEFFLGITILVIFILIGRKYCNNNNAL